MALRFKAFGFMAAGIVALCAACGGADEKPAEHPVVKMAPFDLDCPKDQIDYQHLDNGVWGVTGCGKRTKYIKVCRQVRNAFIVEDECKWIQN